MTTGNPDIEFWFDFGSTYSHLSALRIEALATASKVEVHWKPFLLGPIFASMGWATSPFVLQKRKGDYVWRDMERESARLGIPWKQPRSFPRGSVLAHRVACAASGQSWQPAFCQAVFRRNFVLDLDIDGLDAIECLLTELELPGKVWIDRATSDAVKSGLRRQTDEAKARGIFGAPTFFVDGEMFWGNDRLEQAIEWAGRATRV